MKIAEEMQERNRKPRFWWHGQDLKEDSPKSWFYRRGWLHDRKSERVIGMSLCIPTSFCHAYVEIGGDHDIICAFACWLFSLHVHVEGLKRLRNWVYRKYSYHDRRIEVSLYSWALWWRLWLDSNEYHSKTPKWRDGCFHIDDFFLGKNTYTKVDGMPVSVTIPMPEGDYVATVTTFEQTWKRPRWFRARRNVGMEVEIEGGIPIPGKGENSWDDDDAIMSMGTSATTAEGAIADVIGRVNERRKRYGGTHWTAKLIH